MRGERDFEAYVAARGGTVLRCLLLLGLERREAEEAATVAFAALRPEWQDLAQSADPDVYLWSTVLMTESRRRRRSHGDPLEEALLARVLRQSAALEELEVCEVLGITTSRLRAHLAGATVDDDRDEEELARPLPLPYARVRAAAGRQRRRRWSVSAGVATATALGVLAASWVARPDVPEVPGDSLEAAPSRPAVNPVGVVWWADGELHLTTSVVRVGGVRRLVATGTGAAYVDGKGRLVGVAADGGRTLLGTVAEGSALVSSPRLGLVAWVDVSVPDTTRLVVWDVEEQHEVAAVVTQPRVRPITFDGGWLRFGQGLTDWAWDPSGGPAQLTGDGGSDEPSDRTALVDAVAGTRLEQWGTYLRVVRSGRRGETRFTGYGGALSSDGRYALTGTQEYRRPRLHDARTGEQVDSWPLGQSPVAAVFVSGVDPGDPGGRGGPDPDGPGPLGGTAGSDHIVWLVEQSGDLALVSCSVAPVPDCSVEVDLGRPDRVVVAGDSRR